MVNKIQNGKMGLTTNQSLVLTVLQNAQGPLSAYNILEQLREHGFKAPLQVYRALDKLVDIGKIHRLESMSAFVVCRHSHYGGTHPPITGFHICDDCGCVEEFHDQRIEEALVKNTRESGFGIKRTAIEIHGICKDCTTSRLSTRY